MAIQFSSFLKFNPKNLNYQNFQKMSHQISFTFLCLGAFLVIGTFVSTNNARMVSMTPSQEFAECCSRIEPPLRKDTILDCCKFPPENPTTLEAKDLAQPGHWNPYIDCYTNNKDNRECCEVNGVVGQFQICQQLCDGSHEYPAPPPDSMKVCETNIKGNISMCNAANYNYGYVRETKGK